MLSTKIRGRVLAVLFFCCQSLVAQTYVRVGPSVLGNYSPWFEEDVYLNIGGEISAEFSLAKKITVNIPFAAHYGEHKLHGDVNETVFTENRLVGICPEIRYHPRKRFKNMFYGLGGEIKHFKSVNFHPPSNANPRPFLVGWEYYLGFSIGQNLPYRRGVLTPYLNFGIGVNANEYPVNTRVGFTYGFQSNVKTKKRFNKSKSWQ
jgi:hypothetical protein